LLQNSNDGDKLYYRLLSHNSVTKLEQQKYLIKL